MPGGIVHGGAIASLMDAVLVPAVGSVLGPKDRFSTVDLHVQYIGAVKDEDIVAEGWVTKRDAASCSARAKRSAPSRGV